ncbi:MAG TPA: hypothetical protein VJN02_10115 [Gammaproteobacteria bacterium]|nr:hypothetical protein [Gammaproteobacteria bacterium]
MQNGNVIDFKDYCKQRHLDNKNEAVVSMYPISKDLELAIQHLILQLREFGPIKV